MMFKGTNRMASLNWEKEKPLLQKISDLYEAYRSTKDVDKRKKIYAEIDQVSQEAAQYVSFNEYDDIVSSLGAKGTNAFTSVEQTVYISDIPSNEIGKWMELEAERFEMCVLRLFHTELEAVYEEFNISQDRDNGKGNKALREGLFPNHTYGTQTTIGEGEHLKNPSHVKILEYFDKYYVPNNMALILSGDFDPQMVIKMAEKYFGNYKRGKVPNFKVNQQPKITKPIVKEVIGKEKAYVDFAYRLNGVHTDDPLLAELVKGVLYNRQAGLLDLNVIQKQKAIEANAWTWNYKDFTTFGLYGVPREGQTLDNVKDLLLEELKKVKRGEFDESLIKAVIKNSKLGQLRQYESNWGRAYSMLDAFIKDVDWKKYQSKYERLEQFTKADIVNFAKKNFNDNYVIVYKRTGEDENVYKVEKPSITPLKVNRENKSEFFKQIMAKKADEVKPTFINFDKAIGTAKLKGKLPFEYLKNETNETFQLVYLLEMGKNHDKTLPLAVKYLPYLGTSKYSAEALQKEFFKLGLSFDVYAGDQQTYITLSGLEESFAEGVQLFEHILANVQPDEKALKGMIADILKGRTDKKKDKYTILRKGMFNYAKYGEKSPFTDILTEKELQALNGEELVSRINNLSKYEHRVFYYGTQKPKKVKKVLKKYHKVPKKRNALPKETEYTQVAQTKNKVYVLDFPIVQAEVMLLSKSTPKFNMEERLMSELYNNYFGFGLSSIVFQEIREAKALAYSAYAYYSSPNKKEEAHYMNAYVGTQADKLKDAVTAMEEIIRNMPVSEDKINTARKSIMKKIESEPTTKTRIYWTHRKNQRLGIEGDLREVIYKKMQNVTVDDLVKFQEKYIKNRKFDYIILGDKSRLDMEYLKSIGEVVELSIDDIFGGENQETIKP